MLVFLFTTKAIAEAEVGSKKWLASMGLGFATSPSVLLLSPQMEYPYKPNLYIGPLFQVGIGGSTVFTASGAARYFIGADRKLKPSMEVGLGLTAASSSFGDSSIGVHIHFGMGVDYWIEPDIAIGTMLRANLSPPVRDFFFSWPIAIGRFLI